MPLPTTFEPDYAITAGEHLESVLIELEMTQSDLSARTGLSAKHINQVIKKGVSVSPEIATQLEYATRVPAETWAGLDARHQALQARRRTRSRLADSLDWLDRFNLGELADRGAIPSASRSVETVEALLRFFGIADPDGWERVWRPSMTSFRRSPAFKPDVTATTVWLRSGQRAAARVETQAYDQRLLLESLDELRRLTQLDPSEALAQVKQQLAQVGVALVLIAEFDKCRASGATWWTSPRKAVVVLSNRGKREDRLWFSLFHELGHVLHHAKRDTFIDSTRPDDDEAELPPWSEPAPESVLIDDGSRDSVLEQEADAFAGTELIPDEWRTRVLSLANASQVIELAQEIGVAPGIVAGRYQFETSNFTKFNKLRRPVPHDLFLDPV